MVNGYQLFNINEKIEKLAKEVEKKYQDDFDKIEQVELYNQAKVLKAFQKAQVSQVHFGKSTGYGYDDIGRETIEKIYADIFHTEDSLVRVQFVNGTHTIATALQAMLLPGEKMLAISGKPYDTLCEVIGLTSNSLSLMRYGVTYEQIDLLEDGNFNIPKIVEYLKKEKVKLIHIQRSKGYALRKALYISDIEEVIREIRKVAPNVVIMVDNCYGEFVEELEPTDVGADLVCGSLIKNIGGGLCETGGYIVGKQDLIELCAQKLTCPGIGKECGATLGQNRNLLQGLFMAPSTVKNALHVAIFTAGIMAELGFDVYPKANEKRGDIVQAVKLNDEKKLIQFIQGIQHTSPVDSHVTPYPWDMPGYTDQVIMAAGTFIEGASIELSADSPIRAPYVAYLQGGLTYESAKLSICYSLQKMMGETL